MPLHSVYLGDGLIWNEEPPLNVLFDATAEASEEAVLNALVPAAAATGRDNRVLRAFPVEQYKHLFR